MGVTARPRFASHVLRASGVCHAHLTQRTYPYVKGGMAMPPSVTCPPEGGTLGLAGAMRRADVFPIARSSLESSCRGLRDRHARLHD
jgi:hypothetical protein